MLKLLLDEHISPEVAAGLRRLDRTVVVFALTEWDGGNLLGQPDEKCLEDASKHGLTLVTYDLRTIPPLLKTWAETGRRHSGAIFVDEKTISPADIRGLVKALLELRKESAKWNWSDRIIFLRRW